MLAGAFLFWLPSTPAHAESVVEQWVKRYNGPAGLSDDAISLCVDTGGNVIVTGMSSGSGTDFDYYTAKYAAANGALLWEKRYNHSGASPDYAYATAVDSAGNVIVTGYSSADYYTVKYAAADGAVLWEKRQNGSATGNATDIAVAVAVDLADNVIVTGSSAAPGGNADYYTVKYAAGNGAMLWEKRYNGIANNVDRPNAMVIDSAGNVIVTGGSGGVTGGTDFCTVKYASADGAQIWEKRYNGPGNDVDTANDVAVDGAGNVIVTGTSMNAGENDDYYTAKYAAADGALVWEKRFNGPAFTSDFAFAVAVDAVGNAIVTGLSVGYFANLGTGDNYTIKYAAANGAVLWEKRYNGPGNGDDRGVAIAVDNAGNVFVTGGSDGSGTDGDFYTAKYAAANGALLWEMRYNGPQNGYDSMATFGSKKVLALTPDGGVAITGTSYGPSGGGDFATVKYAPTDADGDGLLDSWEVARFGTTAGHGALDDADGDGVEELLELAFGSDPLVPNTGATPAVALEAGFLTATIARQPGAIYLVQTGATPADAAFSAATTTVLINNATTLKVRDNIPIGTAESRFLRVKVTAAP